MATGGVYVTHNKILPGSYINFVSKARGNINVKDRGVASIAFKNNWGKEDEIITISSEDFQKNAMKIFGHSYMSDELMPIREIFKNAKELKYFRIGTGEKASYTAAKLNIKAKYSGSVGNDIKVRIARNLEDTGATIYTYIKGEVVDEMLVNDSEKAGGNDFIEFSTTDKLVNTASVSLEGGTDTQTTNEVYTKYIDLIEKEYFNTIIYDGDDEVTKGLFKSFIERLRDDEGYKTTLVLYNYPKANFEGVISVKNDKNLVYWVGGATAGANINESLTNKTYDGEYEFNVKYSKGELKDAINNGEFILYNDISDVKVLKDINTFTETTQIKNSDFTNNQIIRVLDQTANDIANIFNNSYIGKIQNNNLGRDMFKSEVIDYFKTLQAIGAIESFEAKDISITKGTEKGDVVVDINIQPVGSMDKLYMKCVIE